jgi:hypothetical protein
MGLSDALREFFTAIQPDPDERQVEVRRMINEKKAGSEKVYP